MSHTMKVREIVIDSRIRIKVITDEHQLGLCQEEVQLMQLFVRGCWWKNGVRARRQFTVFSLIWRKHIIEYLERKCGNACG